MQNPTRQMSYGSYTEDIAFVAFFPFFAGLRVTFELPRSMGAAISVAFAWTVFCVTLVVRIEGRRVGI